MKATTIYIFLLISLLPSIFSSGCRVQQATPDSYRGKQLIFGSGGGFTGASLSYVLLDNGQLFSTDSNSGIGTDTKKYTLLKKLPKTITRQLFSKAVELQLEQLTFSHPGNISYFIGLNNTHTTQRITWGDHRHKAPEGAENLYHQLLATLPL